jgi:hypothetical protein
MIKFKILDTLIKNTFRVFKGETYRDIIHQAKQYNGGGEDYNPSDNTECIATTLNNNDAETVVFLYNDNTVRISDKGEKRIYSTDEENKQIKASVYLKNNGDIEIVSTNNIVINATGNTTINSTNSTITSDSITLNGNCNLGSNDGSPVLTTNTQIIDGQGKTCVITNPATKVKAE